MHDSKLLKNTIKPSDLDLRSYLQLLYVFLVMWLVGIVPGGTEIYLVIWLVLLLEVWQQE